MTIKESVQQMIAEMPDDITWDDIQYRLYLKQVIDESESQISNNLGLSQEQAEEKLSQWLK